MNTSNHTVLITGAGSGIGLALARIFHANGNRLILVGRDAQKLRHAAQELPGAQTHIADITKENDREALIRAHAHITVLINNAGIQINTPFATQSEADIAREIMTNFTAPVLLTRAYLPHLLSREEAAVVNITSGLALVPKESAAVYCAGKAALRSFSHTLRRQLETSPVRVFELVPPLVDTAMTQGRGTGKISPEALAHIFWRAWQHNRYDILAGKSRLLALINRLSPAIAARIMRKAG